jgi:gamma-glutamyltranspeptidase / glutathione hydrolase
LAVWAVALRFAAIAIAPLLLAASPVESEKGVVASAHPWASAAGAEVLRRGGNAIDAAVATAYALAVVEPYSAGIGGGGFLVYREAASGKAYVLDYREVAPKKAHRDMYLREGKVDPKLSLEGMLAVAIPGMVPGLAEAQAKLGKKKLSEVLDAAIDLAEKGFRVDPEFHDASVTRLELLKSNREAARVFLKDGRAYQVGEVLVQKDLAKTLRRLKQEGPRLFTHGGVAQAIAKESQKLGGAISIEDLSSYKPRWREPLIGRYQGHEVITMPPPSSGGTHLLQILGLLEIDRRTRGRVSDWRDWDDLEVLIESMRLAYADRAEYMGDPAFVDVPVNALLAEEYLKRRYALIDPRRARPIQEIGAGKVPVAAPKEQQHTTHLSVIDAEGNAVSLTQTNNYGFGSGVVVPGTGVLLNDEMDDFSAAPGTPNAYGLVGGEANSIQPGKIPLSSMTPTIVVKDGKVRLVVGAPGGATIITTVLQVILHVVDHRMSVDRAVAEPRLHHQWLPDQLRLEPGALDRPTRRAMRTKGYKLKKTPAWGNATAIEVRRDGTRVGAADPRGFGAAVAE